MKLLKEGPGAGYTIGVETLSDFKVNSMTIDNFYVVNGNHIVVSGDCDIDCTALNISANSYYYSTTIKEASANIYNYTVMLYTRYLTDVFTDTAVKRLTKQYYKMCMSDYDSVDDVDLDEDVGIEEIIDLIKPEDFKTDFIVTALYDADLESSYTYGAGYCHSTFDGTLFENDEFDPYYDKGMVEAVITDKKVIEFIDKAVCGETIYDEYIVRQDDEIVDYYEDKDEAIRDATKLGDELAEQGIELSEIDIVVDRETSQEYFNDDIDFIDGERIWSYDEEYY